MAAENELEKVKRELQEAKQKEADMQEHLNDLKAEKELAKKTTTSSKVTVTIDKKQYEIIGNARIGGLGQGQTYTKEELAKSENKELVKSMIEKGSGLIRPL